MGMNRTHYESFKSPPPSYSTPEDYATQAQDVLAMTGQMAVSDEQKMRVEYFDSKFTSLLQLEIQYSVRLQIDEFEFWWRDMVIHSSMYGE